MVWSLEVSMPSSMHASMDIDHQDCRTSRMVNTTINDFRDILPSWIHTTMVWKISKPRWFFQKKSSKRTVSPCSVFLVGLMTPTSFPTLIARPNSEFHRHSAHSCIHDDLSSKRFRFDRRAFQNKKILARTATTKCFDSIYVSLCLRLTIYRSRLFSNSNFIIYLSLVL